MSDPDEVMAYEAEQQRLVEGIMRSLDDATDEDDDYIATFKLLAKDLLEDLCGNSLNTTYPSRTVKFVIELINRPIMGFIGRDKLEARFAEFQYLQVQVFEKVVDAIASRITSEYQKLELGF